MDDITADIALSERPLIVCDVDDVVLQFVGPFQSFLQDHGYRLLPRSFRLHGNIVSAINEQPVDHADVTGLIAGFFDSQERWQVPIAGAAEALQMLSSDADVVFLTAMPTRYFAQRRRLLDSLGFAFPLIATEDAKGPLVARLHASREHKIAFVDDMVHNLHSVGQHKSDCLLVHLPPISEIHRFAPETPDTARRAGDWSEASTLIRDHFGC
ncbi:hypothetical protein [Rhizobium sp. RU36D]|uniref:hypothetical protein n=1 Tax=Rhizobium sp. RU36D TaxID=1907415 RepID=UPI0009D8F7AC|nr:hypothetical protein [Rhizobium sp. RU36D]SMD05896.1 hypothetical protein SAMN05880593_11894 [Rhizobium sp. RU36D]